MKRLKDRSDAEDVLQDFCMRVLARKDQLREVDRMDAWGCIGIEVIRPEQNLSDANCTQAVARKSVTEIRNEYIIAWRLWLSGCFDH